MEHAPSHPTSKTYLAIFGWLTFFTIVEVLATALALPDALRLPALVLLAVLKAGLVVLYYMHLRYDSKWYWFTILVPAFFVWLFAQFIIER
jgi:caa(3)-type oxidase subunit IV